MITLVKAKEQHVLMAKSSYIKYQRNVELETFITFLKKPHKITFQKNKLENERGGDT